MGLVSAPTRRYSPARWAGRAVPFSELARVGATPGYGTADRLDPFWGGMWTQGSSALWVSRKLIDERVAAGLARLPSSLTMSDAEAEATLTSGRHLGSWMAGLGVLDQWRTVSAEQLAAFSGWPVLGTPDPRALVALFRLGVVDRGVFTAGVLPGANLDRSTLFRPSRSDAFDEHVKPLLSWEQQVAVTGGLPWDFRRQYDRHNLLASELALRVAEFCEVGTVLGEKLSDVSLLLGGAPSGGGHAADLTIVRADGLRIAVEMTASTGRLFGQKVRRWARLLADKSLASSGLMVLFVEAAPTDAATRWGRGASERSSVYKEIRDVVREFPGTGADRVAERIGVVSWSQWFPNPGMATREFTTLEVDRPTGPLQAMWERAGLLDVIEVPFTPHQPEAMTAVIGNAATLLGTPHWLRRGRRLHLWPAQAQRVGWRDGLPVPPPSRESRFSGERSEACRGVVGVTTPPVRMRADVANPTERIATKTAALAAVGTPSAVGW